MNAPTALPVRPVRRPAPRHYVPGVSDAGEVDIQAHVDSIPTEVLRLYVADQLRQHQFVGLLCKFVPMCSCGRVARFCSVLRQAVRELGMPRYPEYD